MSDTPARKHLDTTCPTGVGGLDYILCGGLPRNRFVLFQGDPGVGKTTIGLQFLLEGEKHGEKGLFISLSESLEELHEVAQSHGWTLDGLSVFELSALQEQVDVQTHSTLFHPSEVELSRVTDVLIAAVEKVQPTRVVFDSLSELRLLAQEPLRFRRQLLALKQFFAGQKITVVVMDDRAAGDTGREVQSIAHGVIRLEALAPEYGAERRRLVVVKIRGRRFRGGYHDFIIREGGVVVFPRLVAAEHRHGSRAEELSSNLPGMDALLQGGITSGTSTLFMGPPGAGKSTLAAQFASAAASRGQRALAFLFDEKIETFVNRADALGMKWSEHVESGQIVAVQIDPAEVSPGELVDKIRSAVQQSPISLVIIDSLNGYLNAMPEESFLTAQMHELLMFLGQSGVATILVLAQQGIIGGMQSIVDITYLADAVVILRYFELNGSVKQAVSVIKKRSGQHERALREYHIQADGIHVGDPLHDFQGVLTGVPHFQGTDAALERQNGDRN